MKTLERKKMGVTVKMLEPKVAEGALTFSMNERGSVTYCGAGKCQNVAKHGEIYCSDHKQ